MSRMTNARIAGLTFLLYIAAGIAGMALFSGAAAGDGTSARLAAIAQHATTVRVSVLLTLLQGLCALVLGVTLHAITRVEDPDVAMLGLICRVAEGIAGLFVARTLGLLWLATADASQADAGAVRLLGAFLFRMGAWNPGATFFALGSTLFCWLLLRGRMIPVALAWLGVLASIELVVILPLQLTGLAGGLVTSFPVMWLPMLVFEISFALWLLIKGVAIPSRMQPA